MILIDARYFFFKKDKLSSKLIGLFKETTQSQPGNIRFKLRKIHTEKITIGTICQHSVHIKLSDYSFCLTYFIKVEP